MHIGLRIIQVKGLFFDRQSIQSAVSRTERKVLSRFGALSADAQQRTSAASGPLSPAKLRPTARGCSSGISTLCSTPSAARCDRTGSAQSQ